jgi:hypothetical protein
MAAQGNGASAAAPSAGWESDSETGNPDGEVLRLRDHRTRRQDVGRPIDAAIWYHEGRNRSSGYSQKHEDSKRPEKRRAMDAHWHVNLYPHNVLTTLPGLRACRSSTRDCLPFRTGEQSSRDGELQSRGIWLASLLM